MDESLRGQIETYLTHLNGLIRRGDQLRADLSANPTNGATVVATRRWQEDCGATINQLSGGSKAHWLARAFSEAFLMRSADGRAAQGAAPAEIVQQLLAVLAQAVTTLSAMDVGAMASAAKDSPAPRRFDFVHNREIRPVLEQAYAESRRALEKGEYDSALNHSSGVLEAIVTDALEHAASNALASEGAPVGKVADWPFETRLAVAEKAGLIRGGWVRLPPAARGYRDEANARGEDIPRGTVSERDARQAAQVLHVVMKDLDPGR
jgi:hypothetical protein